MKIKTYDPTIVTLTEDEFKKLKGWEPGKYQRVKDLFLFGCMTSLRYSDLVSIREHHIINNNIVKKSEKTDIQQIIPLTRLSSEILERYNYNLQMYTTQTYNRLLKKMGQESGIFDLRSYWLSNVEIRNWKFRKEMGMSGVTIAARTNFYHPVDYQRHSTEHHHGDHWSHPN